MFQNLIAVIRR